MLLVLAFFNQETTTPIAYCSVCLVTKLFSIKNFHLLISQSPKEQCTYIVATQLHTPALAKYRSHSATKTLDPLKKKNNIPLNKKKKTGQ